MIPTTRTLDQGVAYALATVCFGVDTRTGERKRRVRIVRAAGRESCSARAPLDSALPAKRFISKGSPIPAFSRADSGTIPHARRSSTRNSRTFFRRSCFGALTAHPRAVAQAHRDFHLSHRGARVERAPVPQHKHAHTSVVTQRQCARARADRRTPLKRDPPGDQNTRFKYFDRPSVRCGPSSEAGPPFTFKISMLHEFCGSHGFAHFAALFIDPRAE